MKPSMTAHSTWRFALALGCFCLPTGLGLQSCSKVDREFNPIDDRDAASDAASDAADIGDGAIELDGGMSTECLGKDDGEPCGQVSGMLCIAEGCNESRCGDGYTDSGAEEDCDDGNTLSGDGCEPQSCAYSCTENADCNDQFPCNGVETCDVANKRCMPGSPPDSSDRVACVREVPVVDAGAFDAGGNDSGLTDAGPMDAGSVDAALADAALVDAAVDATVDSGLAEDPTAGICKSSLCVPAGCGNAIKQAGEQCDDGNFDNGDGCDADCTYSCENDDECSDANICTGTETCDLDTHTCQAGKTLKCDDDNDCTDNDCDPLLGCEYPLIDGDGDGHADEELGSCGDDCDDDDETIFTGAGELCDGKDNDCDIDVDENKPTWFVDCDGDGYAGNTDGGVQACNAPDPTNCGGGWTALRPTNTTNTDCYDASASVRPTPNPDSYSAAAVAGKSELPFDWNCDGVEERQLTRVNVSTTAYCGELLFELSKEVYLGRVGTPPVAAQFQIPYDPNCYGAEGYTGGSRPACGEVGTYTFCSGYFGCHRVEDGTHTQECR